MEKIVFHETGPYNTVIQRIIREYYQQLYANKMDNVEEIDKFLEKYNFPKLDQPKSTTVPWNKQSG